MVTARIDSIVADASGVTGGLSGVCAAVSGAGGEANLQEADLRGAILWNADFQVADLTNAEIEEKWRDAIDWNRFNLKGMPSFVRNITDELPPKSLEPEKMEEERVEEAEEAAEETPG